MPKISHAVEAGLVGLEWAVDLETLENAWGVPFRNWELLRWVPHVLISWPMRLKSSYISVFIICFRLKIWHHLQHILIIIIFPTRIIMSPFHSFEITWDYTMIKSYDIMTLYYDQSVDHDSIIATVMLWLVVWNMFYFPIYWEFHHPKWRTHIFQRGLFNHQPDILW